MASVPAPRASPAATDRRSYRLHGVRPRVRRWGRATAMAKKLALIYNLAGRKGLAQAEAQCGSGDVVGS
jgi:hypothetical protein